jgi:hypothetical protein
MPELELHSYEGDKPEHCKPAVQFLGMTVETVTR